MIHRVSDPDPVGSGVLAWIRIRIQIRFSNISGSGSGFQISLDPDPVFKFSGSGPLDPVSAKILENCRKVSKSDLSEET